MTTQIILHELKHIGAELSLAGDRLKLKARKGSIPGELQALIEAHRAPLIEHLRASGFHEVPTDADAIRPHPANEPARLSCAQQQIWFAAQLDVNNPVHNVPGRLRMRGQLDVERLQAALAAVLQRHDALQSDISQSDGEALVRSVPCELKLPLRDLSHLSGAERDIALDREFQEFIDTPFLTTAAPLVRFQLFRVQPDDHTLAFVAHHIVFDGTSREILTREIAQAYRVKATGPNFAPHAPVRFLDFAQWHREWLVQADLATERAYWSDRLSEMPTVLEFPPDYPRPTRLSHAGLHQSFVLEHALFEALRQIATAQRTTLNMLLLASIELVLAGYSGQVDFGVGVPVQARNRLDCEATIGMFVNTVVMRSEVRNGGSFLDFLERVRDTSLDALEHQTLPFAELVRLLRPQRDQSRTPLYQVLFSYERAASPLNVSTELQFEELSALPNAAITDLAFWFFEHGSSGTCAVSIARDLFSTDTLGRLIRSWQRVLREIALDPTRPILDLSIIAEQDERYLLHELNRNHQPWDNSQLIHRLFEQCVDARREDTAVIFEDQSITWAALDRRSNQLAHRLRRLGVTTDDRVGVCLDRGIDLVAAILAVLKAGAGYVPLDPSFPGERIAQVLSDAGARTLITTTEVTTDLTCPTPCLRLDRDAAEISAEADTRLVHDENSRQLAYVIYTSGSTGRPKGVMVEHRNVVSLFVGMRDAIGLNQDGVWLAGTTVAFDISVLEILGSLTHGRTVVLLGKTLLGQVIDPRFTISEMVSRHRVTHFQCTPSQSSTLLLDDSGRKALASLCQLIVGGEALAPDLARNLLEQLKQGELVNGYGPTETTVYSTIGVIRPDEPIHIGRPIANTKALVLNERRQLVPFGAVGELYVGGPGVTRGYLGKPELTNERFVQDEHFPDSEYRFYRTGDLVRYLPNGTLAYLGRNDHQLKLRGFRIELGEIESALRDVQGVEQAAVVSRGEGDQKHLIAFVVVGAGYPADQGVRQALRRRLPEYMIPSAVVTLLRFPFTPSGKLDRRALTEGSLSESVVLPATAAQFDAPKDRLEEQLLGIWRHVLPRVDSNVSANFFDLGGHSLVAVQIFNHIQLAFGVRLPLATLFECPTIRQLAERIRAQLAPDATPTQARWTTLVPMQTQGSLPPFFCVAGLGGNTLNLRFLGDHLGEGQPFYGLQHRGVDGVLVPHSTIEEMAREFVAEIVALQPEGPYYIAGYSTGGLAAYEICQQLFGRDAVVGLLILLDTFNPATLNWSLPARVGEHWKKVRSEGGDYVLERSVAHVRRRLENTRRRIRAHLANQNRFEYRMDAVVEATLAAERNYVARPIDADVLLVQAVQAAPALAGIGYPPHESNGWRSLVCGRLDIVPIECHHLDLVSPRVAPTAAAAIRTALSGARGDAELRTALRGARGDAEI